MKLLVGLGNPGPKYQLTRHNIGFLAIDALAEKLGSRNFREEHKALTLKTEFKGEPVLLVKPQTFMNLSGESVRPIMDFYKIELKDILVLHDEVDIPFCEMRFQIKRGHGGHNGVRNLHLHLNTNDYGRLRLGVGRSPNPHIETGDFVLQNFAKEEMPALQDFLGHTVEAVEFYMQNGLNKAADKYNSKPTNG